MEKEHKIICYQWHGLTSDYVCLSKESRTELFKAIFGGIIKFITKNIAPLIKLKHTLNNGDNSILWNQKRFMDFWHHYS